MLLEIVSLQFMLLDEGRLQSFLRQRVRTVLLYAYPDVLQRYGPKVHELGARGIELSRELLQNPSTEHQTFACIAQFRSTPNARRVRWWLSPSQALSCSFPEGSPSRTRHVAKIFNLRINPMERAVTISDQHDEIRMSALGQYRTLERGSMVSASLSKSGHTQIDSGNPADDRTLIQSP